MKRNQIKAIVGFLGGMGVIFIMLGIFTGLEFMLGLIIAMVFWISSGSVSQLLEEDRNQHQHRSIPRSEFPTKTEWSNETPSSQYCPKCGEVIEADSIFCTKCGAKFSG
jgi:hypothetical protein